MKSWLKTVYPPFLAALAPLQLPCNWVFHGLFSGNVRRSGQITSNFFVHKQGGGFMRSYYHRLAFAHHSYSIQMRPLRRFKQVIWGDIWHFPGAGAWNASLMCSFILYTHYHVQPLVNSRRLTAICIQCIDIVNTTIGCIMRMMIRRT